MTIHRPVGPARAGERFDRLFAEGGVREPHDLYREFREREPVFWSESTNAWVVTRYDDVRRLLGTEAEFAVLHGEAGATIHGKSLLQMRGREHRRTKSVIAREIRNLAVLESTFRPAIEQVVGDLIDDLRGRSDVELRRAFTGAVPLAVITAMLGIGDPERIRGWYQDLALAGVENLVGNPDIEQQGLDALHRFEEVIAPVIEREMAEPGSGVLGALARMEHDGAAMSEAQLTTLAGFLLTAGVETTDRTMASLLYRLAHHPAEWRALEEDPELILPAVAETLRFEPAVHGIGRLALGDARFGDFDVAKGERLIGLIGSANRDDDRFPDPDRFALDRFSDSYDRQFTPAGDILTFGAGPHHCTGSLLAKLEMSIAMGAVVESFDGVSLAGSSPPPTGVMLRAPVSVIGSFISN